MSMLNYMKKINIQNYEDVMYLYGERIRMLFNSSNEMIDEYFINKNKNHKQNDIIYGFPYINASSNTYLKDSSKSRVKTYVYDNGDFINVKTKAKYLPHELMYSKNKEIAEDFDELAKLIKSIKNIKKINKIEPIVNNIENEIENIKIKYNINEKLILGFDFEDNIELNLKIKSFFEKDHIIKYESNKDYNFLEIEINDSFLNVLSKLKELGFDKIKYNNENYNFDSIFSKEKFSFYTKPFYSLEFSKALENEIENLEFDR